MCVFEFALKLRLLVGSRKSRYVDYDVRLTSSLTSSSNGYMRSCATRHLLSTVAAETRQTSLRHHGHHVDYIRRQ